MHEVTNGFKSVVSPVVGHCTGTHAPSTHQDFGYCLTIIMHFKYLGQQHHKITIQGDGPSTSTGDVTDLN